MRIKRGHRKTDQEPKGTPSASFNHPAEQSPAPSDVGDTTTAGPATKARDTNGVKKKSTAATAATDSVTKTSSAFDLYCEKERPALEEKAKDTDMNVEEELEKGWQELPESEKETYRGKAQDEVKEKGEEEEEDAGAATPEISVKKDKDDGAGDSKAEDAKPDEGDEDVEMKNYDTEDAEPSAEREDKEGED